MDYDVPTDEALLNIDLYTIEGIEYRNIILKKSRLNYLIPICDKYNIMYYELLSSLYKELDGLHILNKCRIKKEYFKTIRNP